MADTKDEDGRSVVADFFNKAKSKVIDFVSDSRVETVGDIAYSALDIGYKLGTSTNPAMVATGVLSTLQTLNLYVGVDPFAAVLKFAENKGLVEHSGVLASVLWDLRNRLKLSINVVFKNRAYKIRELCFSEKDRLYVVSECSDDEARTKDDNLASAFEQQFWATPDFDFSLPASAIWKIHPNGIFITLTEEKQQRPYGRVAYSKIVFKDITPVDPNMPYIGALDPKDIYEEIVQCHHMTPIMPRSYMLAGAPGTGKSSFVHAVGKLFSNRMVQISPSALEDMQSSDMIWLAQYLKMSVLLLEDFDRVATRSDHDGDYLFSLEEIKKVSPKTTLFANVNNFDSLDRSLIRPGRMDSILWFELPDEALRRAIIGSYVKWMNISITSADILHLAKHTDGLSPAYIKELCARVKHKGMDVLNTTIIEFRRTLDDEDIGGELMEPTKKRASKTKKRKHAQDDGEDIDMSDI